MAQKTLSGVYRLQNAREMAAAFEFTDDGKFQFYFVYGAADRFANGTYSIEGNTLKLISNKRPGTDFTVLRETKTGQGVKKQCLRLCAPKETLVAARSTRPESGSRLRPGPDISTQTQRVIHKWITVEW